jgi:thiamine kinase-like enzyme
MQDHAPESNISVKEVQLLEVDNSASILAVLTAGRTDRLIGHFGLQVHFEKDGRREKRNMVMKIKPHGREIVAMLDSLAAACGGKLADVYHQYRQLTGFQHTHLREQEIYKTLSPSFTPEIYGVYTNAEDEVYIILMEYLQEVDLLNSVMTPEKWSNKHIKKALVQMAQWHAGMLNKTKLLDQSLWDDAPSRGYMKQLTPLWTALLENAAERFPDLYTPERTAFLQRAIETIPQRWSELEKQPLTLVHNDLNPRNTCFKLVEGHLRFCAYDWELSTFHVPQYDVAEFLSFVLDAERYPLRSGYLEFYRKQLHQLTGCYADKELFKKVFRWAALDFGLHRIGMYMMAHTISPYPFLPRVVNSFFDTVMVQESVTA